MADAPKLLPTDKLRDGYPKINIAIDNANEAKKISIENKGLNTNAGAIYPLDNVIRGGQTHTVDDQIKNVVLYAEVIGAKKDKYYTIDFFANGILVDGVAKWGVSLSEHNKDTFSTKLEFGRRLIHYGTDNFAQPSTDIVTRYIRLDEDGLTFVITYDKSKITSTSLNIGDYVYGRGKGCIIHENKYIYGFKDGYLRGNQGITYPLKNVERDGAIHKEVEDIRDAILDIKLTNTNPNKIYKVSYIANGTTAWGAPNYSIFLNEHDKDFANKRVVFDRFNQNLSAPTGQIETKIISNSKEKIMMSITIDYSKLTKDKYQLDSSSYDGYGYIIDPSCCIPENTFSPSASTIIKNNEVAATKSGRKISVKFKYDAGRNMIIDFDSLGINKVTNFKRFFLEDNNKMTTDFPALTALEDLATDWISPYGILAKNNPVSAFGGTVGGNHGTDSNSGFPTASHVETKVYIDSEELTDGTTKFGNKVTIVATHLIAASNTINTTTGAKRDSVKEIITYVITPRHVKVSVVLEALENVEFTRYTGLQSTARYWGDNVYFMEDTTKQVFKIASGTANSGTFPTSKPNRSVLRNLTNDALVVYLNHNIGIGTNYIADNEPVIYTTDNTKLYLHLVKGKNMTVNAGNCVYYSGGYVFSPDSSDSNVETAYSYYDNNEKIYVLDFFQAGEVFFMPDATDLNREIEVIKKSNTITADNFIAGKGLKVSASGYGQLFFKVK